MTKRDLLEILELEEHFYKKLSQIYEITQELGEAIEWQDSVSIRMLIDSRSLPIMELQSIKKNIELKCVDLTEEDAYRIDQLLSGLKADTDDEEPIVRQIANNRRMLEKLKTLDKAINRKFCNEHTFYEQ